MSYLRPGRGGESRRSVFYTGNSSAEDWELVDAPPKDFPEQKHPDTHRRTSTPCSTPHPHESLTVVCYPYIQFTGKWKWKLWQVMKLSSLSDSFGSSFTFDFGRNSSRPKRPLLRDMMGPGRFGRNAETRSAESSPVECNGSKSLEMQLRLQSQQEELSRMQQEQAQLREELASQKVGGLNWHQAWGSYIILWVLKQDL